VTRPDERAVPRCPPTVASAELDGELVLYDEDRRRLIVLNETAALVWSSCDGTRTVGEMIDEIAAAYTMERENVAEDVTGLIDDLMTEDLLTAGPNA
jgi:hypothetical protein